MVGPMVRAWCRGSGYAAGDVPGAAAVLRCVYCIANKYTVGPLLCVSWDLFAYHYGAYACIVGPFFFSCIAVGPMHVLQGLCMYWCRG